MKRAEGQDATDGTNLPREFVGPTMRRTVVEVEQFSERRQGTPNDSQATLNIGREADDTKVI